MAIYTPRMRSLGNINSTPFNSVQTAKNINPITRVIRNIGNIDAVLSPMSIFSSGVGGCWLDPSDMTTMYQDAAGTTPVTAVEQPVGLILDKSQGLMLGPELVSNGTFDTTATGWFATAPATISAQSGELLLTNTSNGFQEQANYNLTPFVSADRMYKVSMMVRRGTATSYAAVVDGNSVSIYYKQGYVNTEYQLISFYFTYPATQTSCTLRIRATGIGTVFADNISVRELKGNHATQSITASRPTLSARKNLLLATEALATQSVTTIAAQYTLSFTGTGSVTLSGASTGTLTGNGTDRVSLTFTPTEGTLTLTVSGSVTKAQLELGTSAGQYQRVNTATDYDTDERYFPKYLKFDGVDDYLNLPYMGLYANGSASVVAGVYLQPKATTQYIIGETTSVATNSRYAPLVIFTSPPLLTTLIRSDSNVVLIDLANISTALPPLPSVISIVDTGNNVSMRKKGVLVSTANYSRASTLTANTTTIGALGQATAQLFAQMNLYSLIITKSALTDAQRIKCERYAASKAGVIL